MNRTGIAYMKRCFLILACVVLVGCERPVFEVLAAVGSLRQISKIGGW